MLDEQKLTLHPITGTMSTLLDNNCNYNVRTHCGRFVTIQQELTQVQYIACYSGLPIRVPLRVNNLLPHTYTGGKPLMTHQPFRLSGGFR